MEHCDICISLKKKNLFFYDTNDNGLGIIKLFCNSAVNNEQCFQSQIVSFKCDFSFQIFVYIEFSTDNLNYCIEY